MRIIRRVRRSCAILAAAWTLGVIPAPAQAQDKPIGEAPEERDADEVFLRGQRVLLGRGDVVLDFGQFYSRSDDLRLALVDQAVALATLEQTVLTTVLVGRLGIGRETEVFAATSFTRQSNRLFVGSTDLADNARSEIGRASCRERV